MENRADTAKTTKTIDSKKSTGSSEPSDRSPARVRFSWASFVRTIRHIGIFLLVIAISAALFYFYSVRHTVPILPTEAAAPVADLADGQAADSLPANGERITALEESVQQNMEALSLLRTDLARLENNRALLLSDRSASDRSESDRGEREQWALDEIYFLLSVANERLTLNQDVRLALAALQRAHHRLLGLGYEKTDALYQQILSEIESLEMVVEPDNSSALATLSELIKTVESLPFRARIVPLGSSLPEKRGKEEETSVGDKKLWYQRLWDEARMALGQLVAVERVSDADLLTQQGGEYYHKQRLVIRLDNASWALLRKNQEAFDASLETALELLRTRFDSEEREVNAAIGALDELSGMILQPALPDISGSLQKMDQYRHQQ